MIRPAWPARRQAVWRRAIGTLYGIVVLGFLLWALGGAPLP